MKKKFIAWREKKDARKSAVSEVNDDSESSQEELVQNIRIKLEGDKKKVTVPSRPPQRRVRLTRFEAIKHENPEEQTALPNIPFLAWAKVFSNLSIHDSRSLALSALGFSEMWLEYQKNTQEGCRHILVKRNIFPEDLFIAAEKQGINVNYILLNRLYHADRQEALKLTDLPDDNLAPIAAISGDMPWLFEHVEKSKFPAHLEHICFSQTKTMITNLMRGTYINEGDIQRSALMMSAFAAFGGQETILDELDYPQAELPALIMGGHLKLAWKRQKEAMLALRNTSRASDLSLVAAQSGHFDICDHLEKHYGALPGAKNKSDQASQIHFAAYYDDKVRVNHLLETLYNYQMPADQNGLTPLHYAVKGGAENTAMELLERYTKYQRMLAFNMTNPLVLAVLYGHTSLLKRMMAKYPVDLSSFKDENRGTLLYTAAKGGHWDTFMYLREQKVLLVPKRNRELPIFSAFINLRVRFIEKYLELCGLENLTYANKEGETVAFFLLNDQDLNTIDYLISKYDIDLNVTNLKEQTPMLELANTDALHNEDGWKQIAACVEKFNHLMSADWQTKPDVSGKAFVDLVDEHGQQDKFPQFYGATKSL